MVTIARLLLWIWCANHGSTSWKFKCRSGLTERPWHIGAGPADCYFCPCHSSLYDLYVQCGMRMYARDYIYIYDTRILQLLEHTHTDCI